MHGLSTDQSGESNVRILYGMDLLVPCLTRSSRDELFGRVAFITHRFPPHEIWRAGMMPHGCTGEAKHAFAYANPVLSV